MEEAEFLDHFDGVKPVHNGHMALCPVHDDHDPSLLITVSEDGTRIRPHCFAGCSTKAVLAAKGLTETDTIIKGSKPSEVRRTEYRYYNADGSLLYIKVRIDYTDGTKKFYFVQPNGKMGAKGVTRVIYNLPDVYQAETAYLVEGEKCAQALIDRGYVATTLDSGSNSKWLPEYAPYFEGKKVIIIPDNDEPGRKYARMLKQNIPHAIIKELPGLGEKEDVYDWLASGHTMDELDALPETQLAEEAAPEEHQEEQKKEQDTTQAGTLLDLFQQSGAKVFLNETSDPYAALPIGSHSEIVAVESRSFSGWLHRLYYQQTKHTIRQEAVTQVITILSADAIYGAQEKTQLYNRVAAHQGTIWYDLSNPAWQAIKVSAKGWTVENTPPILFYRYRHQNPQVLPQRGGDIKRVFRYVNMRRFQLLFLCWLVTCFVPDIPHPMPILYGEKGAAKSTACVLLKRLIDPSASDTLPLHNDSRNLVVNLQQHWFLPFDNVSSISGDTSDTLCRAITGGSIQQRKLYTDAEDVIFNFMRCLTINGINNVANRSDLLDRSILLELERVPETERKELAEVYQQFEEDRATILGGAFLMSFPRQRRYSHPLSWTSCPAWRILPDGAMPLPRHWASTESSSCKNTSKTMASRTPKRLKPTP